MTLRPLILASLLFLTAAPAHAADTVLRTAEVDSLDAYHDRVAWVEDDGELWTAERGKAVALGVKADDEVDVAAGPVAEYARGMRFYRFDFATHRERAIERPRKARDVRVDHTTRGEDVEEYRLVYRDRVLLRVAHGASGDLSLAQPLLSATKAYVTQRGGEFGGPWRLWRVDLKTGRREYAGLPSGANSAVPVGAKRVVAYVCAKDPCQLISRSVTWRR